MNKLINLDTPDTVMYCKPVKSQVIQIFQISSFNHKYFQQKLLEFKRHFQNAISSLTHQFFIDFSFNVLPILAPSQIEQFLPGLLNISFKRYISKD